MRSATVPLIGLISGVLSAQSVVSPNHFATAESNSGSIDGFGHTAKQGRYLQVQEDIGTKRTVRAIWFRRDGDPTQTRDYPAWTLVATLDVSTGVTSRFSINSVFDKNHGKDRTRVAAFKPFNFPAVKRGTVPHPWTYRLPFDKPFAYAGGGAFCWDLTIHHRTNTVPIQVDAALTWDNNPPPVFFAMGTGCKSTGAVAGVALKGSSPAHDWVKSAVTLRFAGANLPRSANVFLSIGGSARSAGGIPLPFVLPGTANGSSGPCRVYADSLLALGVSTSAAGGFRLDVKGPLQRWFHGASLFAQVYAPDRKANPFGLVSSNLLQIHLVAPFGVTPISNVVLNGKIGSSGQGRPMQGIVVKLD